MKRDPLNLIVSGIGGQGNILIARLLGRLFSSKGYFVTIGETFGAAQRGGGGVQQPEDIQKRRAWTFDTQGPGPCGAGARTS